MTALILVVLSFMAVTAIALTRVRDLFGLVVLLSVYSGLLATVFALMGAVDVAFTEAVVGTSVSTVFFMALMWWIDPYEVTPWRLDRRVLAAIPAALLGGVLIYGAHALPPFGDPEAPAMAHVSPYYIQHSYVDMATPNVVTAVLADYRSLDTLIETAVVFVAAAGCLLILMYRDDPGI
ncbi:MAG: hydrogen gas-evolving membrane-bound hydrogenase subunit E [Gemmatimonadota bacterium]